MKRPLITLFIACGLILSTHAQHVETGLASYYSDASQGMPTASGELYDKRQYTAAHLLLDFGTIVRVVNVKNGRAVNVKINDVGPSTKARVIDLSRAAAEALGMVRDGVVQVRIEEIGKWPSDRNKHVLGPVSAASSAGRVSDAPPTSFPPAGQASTSTQAEPIDMTGEDDFQLPGNIQSQPPATLPTNTRMEQPAPTMPDATPVVQRGSGLFKFYAARVAAEGYGIQVGAYADYRNVMEVADKLHSEGMEDLLIHARVVDGKDVFRLIVGPFNSRGLAETYVKKLDQMRLKGVIVTLTGMR